MVLLSDYINVKDSLNSLSDDYFDSIVDNLAFQLESNGFPNKKYPDNELLNDWNKLINKNTKDININSSMITGTKIIKHYMPNFYDVSNHKGVSIKSLWRKEYLKNALIFNRKYHSTPYYSEIVRSLGFTAGVANVTMYRPLLAKQIVDDLNAKSVLDCCVGWGGRMLGSSSLNVPYTGIEPDTITFNNLNSISKFLNLKDVNIINGCAENILPKLYNDNKKFDLGLTSPPYYNLELYSNENTQSTQKYDSYLSWRQNFLEPCIKYVCLTCKYSAWSIKNFKSDKKYPLLDDVFSIHYNLNYKCIKQYSLTNSCRPGAKSSNNVKTKEQTYIFTK